MLLVKFRLLKKEVKRLHSLICMLKDALTNNIGQSSIENIIDSISCILDKNEYVLSIYNSIFESLDEYEDYMQIQILLSETFSILKILKYSLKARRSPIDYDDIFNCLNVLSKYSAKLSEYSHFLAKFNDINNVTPLWNN